MHNFSDACLFRFLNVGFRSTEDGVLLERNFLFGGSLAPFFRRGLSAIVGSDNVGEIRGNDFISLSGTFILLAMNTGR